MTRTGIAVILSVWAYVVVGLGISTSYGIWRQATCGARSDWDEAAILIGWPILVPAAALSGALTTMPITNTCAGQP